MVLRVLAVPLACCVLVGGVAGAVTGAVPDVGAIGTGSAPGPALQPAPGGGEDSDADDPTPSTPGDGAETPDAGSGDQEGPLSVASVSPWVPPDGVFQVRFDPATTIPDDAQLTVTIHQALDPDEGSLRDAVEEIIDGAAPGRVLQTPRTRPFAELGDPASGAVLSIPVRSTSGDSDRVLLPNPGVHPVELVLTTADGPELWSQVVFLNRMPRVPDGDQPRPPVRVTLLLPFGSGPAIDESGEGALDVEERGTLRSVGALVEDAEEVPLTLAPRPNTLDGLTLTEETWAQDLLGTLADRSDAHGTIALPYASIDTGGLVASGRSEELSHQIALGRDTVERLTGNAPSSSTWVLDDTVTAASLAALAREGVESVVLPATSFELDGTLEEADVSSRPVRLDGDSGIRALAYDGPVSGLLAGPADDPGTRAHEVVTMLMGTWFDAAGDGAQEAGPASVVLVTSGTDVRVLQALGPSLLGDGPLQAEAGEPLPSPDPDLDEPVVALADRAVSDQRGAAEAAEDTRRLTDAYASMTGEGDPSLWAWQRMVDQTLATTIDDGRRLQLHLAVRDGVDGRVAEIEPPRPRSVVVTSRETTVPLRFRNDLPFDVTLRLRARSPRLEIGGGGVQRIVLHPGENRVDLPVTVQAPGESLLRIELGSPVPGIALDGPDIPVRSTAISGVGAALSIVSILFLVGWWIHTHRRGRRSSAKLNGGHPSGPSGTGSLGSGG